MRKVLAALMLSLWAAVPAGAHDGAGSTDAVRFEAAGPFAATRATVNALPVGARGMATVFFDVSCRRGSRAQVRAGGQRLALPCTREPTRVRLVPQDGSLRLVVAGRERGRLPVGDAATAAVRVVRGRLTLTRVWASL